MLIHISLGYQQCHGHIERNFLSSHFGHDELIHRWKTQLDVEKTLQAVESKVEKKLLRTPYKYDVGRQDIVGAIG